MAREKAPAFQFYPRDFLSDPTQASMSAAGAGAYIRLMCYCWLNVTIPGDAGALARLAGMTPREWARVAAEVLAAFTPDGDSYRHGRLERIRAEHAAGKDERSASGKRGAQARWGRSKRAAEPHGTDGSAMAQPLKSDSYAIANDASSSSSSGTTPPVAPLGEGGEPARILRRHRTEAERIRDKAWGRCQHDPPCDSRDTCVGLIALGLAERGERVA